MIDNGIRSIIVRLDVDAPETTRPGGKPDLDKIIRLCAEAFASSARFYIENRARRDYFKGTLREIDLCGRIAARGAIFVLNVTMVLVIQLIFICAG